MIYRKILAKEDRTKLQRVVVRLVEWSVEKGMKINPSKIKTVSFTRARIKVPLNYYLLGMLVPEESN